MMAAIRGLRFVNAHGDLMQASVIVSTYNRREMVLRTVRTLLQQDFASSEFEIVVVVDGSTDATAEALRAVGDRVRVLKQENRGLAGARNSGARAAHGELLIFLDDDMECPPALVGEHVRAHAAAGEVSDIAGLGAIYAAPASPRWLAAEHFNRGLGAPYLRQRERPDEPWPEDVWSFGNTSIRRSVLERAGGFDERFRMREDREFGMRLQALGVRQHFVPEAVAYQWCDKTAGQLVRDARNFAASDLLFMQSHAGEDSHGFLNRLRSEAGWKRRVRRLLIEHLRLADLVLAPLCGLGERLPAGPLRKLAIRALLLRCGVHWLHRLVELSGTSVDKWLAE